MPRGRELRRLLSEWLTKQSFQIDEATAERDALVLPSKSRGAEIRLSYFSSVYVYRTV